MPARSKSQMRWVASAAGKKALGTAGQKEWLKATKGKKLPEKVAKKKAKR